MLCSIEFGKRYHFINEFLDHENTSIDTLFELIGAIVSVLCHYTCKILKSERIWQPYNRELGGYKLSLDKDMTQITPEMNSLTMKT